MLWGMKRALLTGSLASALVLLWASGCSTSTTGTQTATDAGADATADTGTTAPDATTGKDASADASPDSSVDDAGDLDAGQTDADAQDADAQDAGTDAGPADAGTDAAPDAAPMPLALSSGAFANNGDIPVVYTCGPAGANAHQSPPLAWTGGPAAQSYAIVMVDNDVAAPGNVHWVIYDLAPATQSLAANIARTYQVAAPTARQARDSFAATFGYFYPCPPAGKHTYQFEVFALDIAQLPTDINTSTAAVIAQINAHKLASATLFGKYQK
jgi:Raf kinase inhibitor-like YbhB/YbcL family protein